MRAFSLVCLLPLSCVAAAPATQPVATATTSESWVRPSRQFAFSTIVFNVDYGIWAQGARWEELTDCSNERWHCLASETFRIALPKRCADLQAGRWTVGDVQTEVIYRHVASSSPLHGGGSATTLYLADPERPRLLYVYDPAGGLRGLYWADTRETDFVAMARQGGLDAWLNEDGNRTERQRLYYPLTTFGGAGACR